MEQMNSPGRATHPLSLEPPLPGQDVSRYKAVGVARVTAERQRVPSAWLAIISAVALAGTATLFLPEPVQLAVACIAAVTALWLLWRVL